jgi:sugar O-acyltransferase (sialic acid O-acetyltransferase NeuD family)
MDSVVLIGAGGHCKSVIDVIEATGRYEIVGLIEADDGRSNEVLGYPILGSDRDLPRLIDDYETFLIAIGQITSPRLRIETFDGLLRLGAKFPTVFSPRAYVSKHASIGIGTVVMHGAVVNSSVQVGNNCIVNSMSLIEHDAIVEDHCHVSTGARVNGGAFIGAGSFIGSGAILKHGVSIGARSIVGAGSLILSDLPANSRVQGDAS